MRLLLPALAATLLQLAPPLGAEEAPAVAAPPPAEDAPLLIPAPLDPAVRDMLHAEIRSYLLAHPEILSEMVDLLDARRQAETAAADRAMVAENAAAIFDDGFSFVGGNPEGSVTIVEFLDYQCGYCRRAHPDITRLVETDGDLRWIVKELPILGPGSELAARAAIATLLAAGPDAYLDLNHRLMSLQGAIDDAVLDGVLDEAGLDTAAIRAGMGTDEVSRRLQATRDLAGGLAISGTPTFVIGDRMLRGAVPLASMAEVIESVRTPG